MKPYYLLHEILNLNEFNKIDWVQPKTVSNKQIENATKELGIKEFPFDFINFIKKYNAATPVSGYDNYFNTDIVLPIGWRVTIDYVLSFNKKHKYNIIDINKKLRNKLPDKVIAIAVDKMYFDHDNYFCYDFRKGTPPIEYWNFEENRVVRVTNNFSDLLKLIGQR